ncbi:MAG: DUF2461 domain-containing protein [Ignavibacteria bacterium]|nr:DUF2461 domain-containing protein [Ignavibacteria bacterium]MBI3765563.1 DUF2461 domain-containing protein [Ignavibacteriales bacterium]
MRSLIQQFPPDLESLPPFRGFPKEGLRFLTQLRKNNTREWFLKHKSEYEDFVKLPMRSLIAALKTPMAKIAPEIEVNPKRSMFRIHRDTRFSKDKTPYKTHVAAVFHLKGKWEDSAGYYVHIEPDTIYVGGGIYMPSTDQLKRIRKAIAEGSDEFLSVTGSKTFKRQFGSLEGDKLQRAPLGYPADHPMVEWLKYKSFYTGVTWNEKECLSPKFVDRVVAVYKNLLPLVSFLNEALGK